MAKISPWFLLLAVVVSLFYFTSPDGGVSSNSAVKWLAFPAYVVILVALDHLILPRVQWSDAKKARVRAITSLILTAFVVWAMRPSPIVSGLLILAAFQGVWSALSGGKR